MIENPRVRPGGGSCAGGWLPAPAAAPSRRGRPRRHGWARCPPPRRPTPACSSHVNFEQGLMWQQRSTCCHNEALPMSLAMRQLQTPQSAVRLGNGQLCSSAQHRGCTGSAIIAVFGTRRGLPTAVATAPEAVREQHVDHARQLGCHVGIGHPLVSVLHCLRLIHNT